jgi:hypothetical protein
MTPRIFTILLLIVLSSAAGAQPYAGLSIGRTTNPEFFDTSARYAFPDLATGGGDCCTLTHSTDTSDSSFRMLLGTRFANGFGLESSIANLGRFDSSFDVSGAFWTAFNRPDVQFGRCVESGRFRFSALTFAGTYQWGYGREISIVPKIGVSAMLVDFTTQSHCEATYTDGTTAVADVPQDKQRLSFVPMIGAGLHWTIGNGLTITLDAEIRDGILVADSVEAIERGKGRIRMTSIWIGLERQF